ncbi:MAG: hypothetical protein V3T14_13400 [Myxococcota bacterium]
MNLRPQICDDFGIDVPIFLAGMGGVAYAEVCAGVFSTMAAHVDEEVDPDRACMPCGVLAGYRRAPLACPHGTPLACLCRS